MLQPNTSGEEPQRAVAAQYLKDAGGLKLVFSERWHRIFVQTFIAVAEDGRPVGELFVDETVGYDENTDSFVIRTAQ